MYFELCNLFIILTTNLSNNTYVAESPTSLDPGLVTQTGGNLRRVFPLKPLSASSRVAILKSALEHYGAPLRIIDPKVPGKETGIEIGMKMSVRDRDAQISSATEGFQPGDIWALSKRLAVNSTKRVAEMEIVTKSLTKAGTKTGTAVEISLNINMDSEESGSDIYSSTNSSTAVIPPVARGPNNNNTNNSNSNINKINNRMLYTEYDEVLSMAKSLSTSTSSSTSLPVSWDDIGGLHSAKVAITDVFQLPVVFRRLFQLSPIRMPRAILLYGPPGCGKTMLAQAAATECGLAFISVRGTSSILFPF